MDLIRANGKICYLQIPTDNVERSVEFYREAFGWSIRTHADGTSAFDDTTGQVSGMWVLGEKPGSSPGIIISIMVDDIKATLEKIVKLGGKVNRPIGFQAPELTAHFSDPYGNILGLYQEPVH